MDTPTHQAINTRPIPMDVSRSSTTSGNDLLRKVPEVVLCFVGASVLSVVYVILSRSGAPKGEATAGAMDAD